MCSRFSTKACAILQVLCWPWQHHKKRFRSSSSFQTLAPFLLLSPLLLPSFYFTLSCISGRNFPFSSPPLLSCYSESPATSFLLRNDTADELGRRDALLQPSTVSCDPSSLTCRIHSFLFSDRRCTILSKFFNAQASSVFTGKLVLPVVVVVVVTRPFPRDRGMVEDHGAPEAGKLPTAWTRDRRETESCQRASDAKSP